MRKLFRISCKVFFVLVFCFVFGTAGRQKYITHVNSGGGVGGGGSGGRGTRKIQNQVKLSCETIHRGSEGTEQNTDERNQPRIIMAQNLNEQKRSAADADAANAADASHTEKSIVVDLALRRNGNIQTKNYPQKANQTKTNENKLVAAGARCQCGSSSHTYTHSLPDMSSRNLNIKFIQMVMLFSFSYFPFHFLFR